MHKFLLLGIGLALTTASAQTRTLENVFYPPREAVLKSCELAFKNPRAPIEPYVFKVGDTPLWFHAPLGFVFNICRSFRNDLDRRYSWRDVATYIGSKLEYPAALFTDFSKQHEFARSTWAHDLTFRGVSGSRNARVLRPSDLGLKASAYPGTSSGVDLQTWQGMNDQALLFSSSSNATALYFESLRDAAEQSSNFEMQTALHSNQGEPIPLSTLVAAGGGEIEVLRFYLVDRRTASSANLVSVQSKSANRNVESKLTLEKLGY